MVGKDGSDDDDDDGINSQGNEPVRCEMFQQEGSEEGALQWGYMTGRRHPGTRCTGSGPVQGTNSRTYHQRARQGH